MLKCHMFTAETCRESPLQKKPQNIFMFSVYWSRESCISLNNTFCQLPSHRNFASFFSACPTSGKPGSSLPQFSMSLRVVPLGRGWWGPAVHNVCFSLRLPLYSAAPAWLWRVAKLWGVVRASGGAACVLPQDCFKHLTSFPHGSRPDINHFPRLADYNGMLGKMLLWIIRLITISSVRWCANDWGSCFSASRFCKG